MVLSAVHGGAPAGGPRTERRAAARRPDASGARRVVAGRTPHAAMVGRTACRASRALRHGGERPVRGDAAAGRGGLRAVRGARARPLPRRAGSLGGRPVPGEGARRGARSRPAPRLHRGVATVLHARRAPGVDHAAHAVRVVELPRRPRGQQREGPVSHPVEESAASWGATVGAIVTYTASVTLGLPAALFFPRLARWGVAAIPGEPAIHWYGWLIDGLLGAVLGMAIGRPFRGRPSWHLVWPLATIALLLLAAHERHWFAR